MMGHLTFALMLTFLQHGKLADFYNDLAAAITGHMRGGPAKTFPGMELDVAVLGFATCLIATDKMSEDVAYKITKAICEGKEELASQYKAASAFDPKKAWARHVPLHPGAVKCYKEAGYMKCDFGNSLSEQNRNTLGGDDPARPRFSEGVLILVKETIGPRPAFISGLSTPHSENHRFWLLPGWCGCAQT